MADRVDRDKGVIRRDADAGRARRPNPEHARLEFASARVDLHDAREHYLLELAVRAPDDDSARQLEIHAHEAYCDAQAIAKEHELDR